MYAAAVRPRMTCRTCVGRGAVIAVSWHRDSARAGAAHTGSTSDFIACDFMRLILEAAVPGFGRCCGSRKSAGGCRLLKFGHRLLDKSIVVSICNPDLAALCPCSAVFTFIAIVELSL